MQLIRQYCFITMAALFLVLSALNSWAVPTKINYQGKLTDTVGNPVSDTSLNLQFAVYMNASGGSPLWSETQAVNIIDGVFNVQLGTVIPFPANLFNDDRYLGIMVGSGAEMTPRHPLLSVPYALKADDATTLGGHTVSDFTMTGHNHDDRYNTKTEIVTLLTGKADIVHSHSGNDITSGTVADGYIAATITRDSELTTGLAGKADSIHGHSGNDITSGTVADARIAASIARDSEIMTTVLGNDGSGSGLDADMVDGVNASSFLTPSTDFGRTGVSANLYEGSVTLASKYVNATGDTIAGSDSNALLTVTNSGLGHGIEITDAGNDGIYIGSPQDGVHVHNASEFGLHIEEANWSGVYVDNTDASGVYVASVGWGVYVESAVYNGVTVSKSGGDGVRVVSAGNDGVDVYDAGAHGIYIRNADQDGIYIEDAVGWAGRFMGNVVVNGTLTKSAGTFKIDHPLDPENKYLSHSFVESPDMMNIYNGNVILDPSGEAWVELPEWFEPLNRNFRYQLTPIGGPGPNLYIAEEIAANRFKIAGGTAKLKVSWQVTGIRQDPYANANRIIVEEKKPDEEKGYYLHPDVYNQPVEKHMKWAQYGGMENRLQELQEEQENREHKGKKHELKQKENS